jgi:hypothetical protein
LQRHGDGHVLYPKLNEIPQEDCMSLRDFNSPSEDRPIILNNEPIGNGSGLEAFHTTNPEDREPNNTGKIVGALAVALMLGAAGVYAYSVSGKSETKQVVAANTLPAPAAPAPVAAQTPPPAAPQQDAMTTPSDATTPATKTADARPDVAPVKTASAKPVKVRTAKADTSSDASSGVAQRMSADTSQPASTPAPEAAVTAPSPSPNDVASNTATPAVSPAQTAPDASQQQANAAPVEQAQPTVQAPAATPAPVQAAPAQTTAPQPAAQPAPAPAQ